MMPQSPSPSSLEQVRQAVSRAFSLGQDYAYKQHAQADITQAKLDALIEETCADLEARIRSALIAAAPAPDLTDDQLDAIIQHGSQTLASMESRRALMRAAIRAALSAVEALGQQEPVAVRYKSGKQWRYLNYPFTRGWTFPPNLGTPEPLYASPALQQKDKP